MTLIIGFIILVGSVISGYLMHHGKLAVLFQPNEYIIIGGAAIGAFVIAHPGHLIKKTAKSFKYSMKGAPFSKNDYLELLSFMFGIFKFMKTKGVLGLEQHLDKPEDSEFFKPFPALMKNHHAVHFVCDYLRLLTMGVDDKYTLEDMMDKELDKEHHEHESIATSVVTLGDSFPALGIVAAVLGVITTMGSISEPPEILGGLIGAALVGTFLGILVSYGLVCPMGQKIGKYFNEEHKYFEVIKTGFLAHVQGNAPAVSVEFARKMIPSLFMPSFSEMESAIEGSKT
jgi:chemotaxis protein MotA